MSILYAEPIMDIIVNFSSIPSDISHGCLIIPRTGTSYIYIEGLDVNECLVI